MFSPGKSHLYQAETGSKVTRQPRHSPQTLTKLPYWCVTPPDLCRLPAPERLIPMNKRRKILARVAGRRAAGRPSSQRIDRGRELVHSRLTSSCCSLLSRVLLPETTDRAAQHRRRGKSGAAAGVADDFIFYLDVFICVWLLFVFSKSGRTATRRLISSGEERPPNKGDQKQAG